MVTRADGTYETNTFVSPDWLEGAPVALSANGRIKVSWKLVDSQNLNQGTPALYSVDMNLRDSASPVTGLLLSFVGGPVSAHAAIFAVSGADLAVQPPVTQPAMLSIKPGAGGAWVLHTSVPGKLQSAAALKGPDTIWNEEGPIASSLTLSPSTKDPARFYRVVSP